MLQLDDLQLRKIKRQLFQVFKRSAAPAVNALVVVTHSSKAGAGNIGVAYQQLEQLVLGGVGILVFIHQHMP